MDPTVTILSPTAILGYGFPERSFLSGMARQPDAIVVDAGSTDPGPYYLGSGKSFTDRDSVKRDLCLIIEAGLTANIPVLVGSAGGAGALPHLNWCLSIVEEVLRDLNKQARVAVIAADQPKQQVLDAYRQGLLTPLGSAHNLSCQAIQNSSHIVAQMGVEPLIKALELNAEIIVAGRCYDPAVFAAVPIMQRLPAGLALHMGKILECAAIAAVPGSGSDCMLGTIDRKGFVLEALNPERSCTVTSVAAHTLYEKADPRHLPGPGGALDLTNCQFIALDSGRVRVTGTKLINRGVYTVKIEAARPIGFRTISIAGIRSPDLIASLDEVLESVRHKVWANFSALTDAQAHLLFRCYGRDGVMGALEPKRFQPVHEIGLVIEVTAESQKLADTLCSFTRSTLLHFGFQGRQATAGNLAFPYSPSDLPQGVVYEFSLYHLMHINDPLAPFPVTIRNLGAKE